MHANSQKAMCQIQLGNYSKPGTASDIALLPGTASRAGVVGATWEPGTAPGRGGAGVGIAPEPGTTPTPANGADGSAAPSGPDTAPEPGTVSGAGDAGTKPQVRMSQDVSGTSGKRAIGSSPCLAMSCMRSMSATSLPILRLSWILDRRE